MQLVSSSSPTFCASISACARDIGVRVASAAAAADLLRTPSGYVALGAAPEAHDLRVRSASSRWVDPGLSLGASSDSTLNPSRAATGKAEAVSSLLFSHQFLLNKLQRQIVRLCFYCSRHNCSVTWWQTTPKCDNLVLFFHYGPYCS